MAPVTGQVFARLLEAVLAGEYAPGERLPRQRDLAADLGVTLGSLREALTRLEQMGLVEVRHGDATRVRDWRRDAGLDVLAHLVVRGGALDRDVLGDVLEARTLMLQELAALAAERRDTAQAAEVERLAGAFAAAADDAAAAAHVDFAFMTALAAAARNLVFTLILNAIRGLYLGHLAAVPVTARPRELAPLYEEIALAVRARDPEAARATTARLAELQRRRVETALEVLG